MDDTCRLGAGPATPRATGAMASRSALREALRHLRRAERAAGPPAGLRDAPRRIAHVAVAGGGPDAAGIAHALLAAGLKVTLVEEDAEAVTRALHEVDRRVEAALARRLIGPDEARARRARLTATTDVGRAAGADLGLEAAPETLPAKQAALAALEAALPPDAVLATCTTLFAPDEPAVALRDPSRLIGLHLPAPAAETRLVEILRGAASSDAAVAAGFALAAGLRRVPVLAGVGSGPVTARLLNRYHEAADTVFMDGSTPWEVDEAMVAFGFASGPYEAQDLTGIDLAHAARRRAAALRDTPRRHIPLADRMLELGKLGRRTGAGWYRYPGGGGKVEDPIVADLALEESHFERRTRTDYAPGEIRHRLVLAMINDAAEILQEGAVASAADMDLLSVHGAGFPRWRGGLMHHADRIGAGAILAALEALAQEDPVAWRPAAPIRERAATGASFGSGALPRD